MLSRSRRGTCAMEEPAGRQFRDGYRVCIEQGIGARVAWKLILSVAVCLLWQCSTAISTLHAIAICIRRTAVRSPKIWNDLPGHLSERGNCRALVQQGSRGISWNRPPRLPGWIKLTGDHPGILFRLHEPPSISEARWTVAHLPPPALANGSEKLADDVRDCYDTESWMKPDGIRCGSWTADGGVTVSV